MLHPCASALMGPACGRPATGTGGGCSCPGYRQDGVLNKLGGGVSPQIPGRRLYEWIAAGAPPLPTPNVQAAADGPVQPVLPAVTLGATAPYREASLGGGVRGGVQGCVCVCAVHQGATCP